MAIRVTRFVQSGQHDRSRRWAVEPPVARLRPKVQADMSPLLRYRLGLDATLNMPTEDILGDLVGDARS